MLEARCKKCNGLMVADYDSAAVNGAREELPVMCHHCFTFETIVYARFAEEPERDIFGNNVHSSKVALDDLVAWAAQQRAERFPDGKFTIERETPTGTIKTTIYLDRPLIEWRAGRSRSMQRPVNKRVHGMLIALLDCVGFPLTREELINAASEAAEDDSLKKDNNETLEYWFQSLVDTVHEHMSPDYSLNLHRKGRSEEVYGYAIHDENQEVFEMGETRGPNSVN